MLSTLPSSIIQFVTRNVYRKEIAIVIGLKVIGLLLLWGLFFSHPTEGQLTPREVAKHLFLTNQR